MHLTRKALSLFRNSNPNLNLYFSLGDIFILIQLRRAVDGESWTDVGKRRQWREVAEERGEDENEIKAKSLLRQIIFVEHFFRNL